MTFSRFIRICSQRLQALVRKDRLDDQLDQELLFHLEELEKENLEAGMNPDEARRAARRSLGNMTVLKEECRDQRHLSWYYDFRQDAAYGIRMMRRHPFFTAVAVIALALGIGANTAILNVGAAYLFGDLPLPDAERLVVIRTVPPESPDEARHASVPDYVAWKAQSRAFESMGVSLGSQQDFGGENTGFAPERLAGQAVTPSLFDTLGVQPQLGRLFRNDEARPGVPSVVILSDGLWKRRFGGDPGILGKQIRLNGRSVEIIGVMPPGFWYPIRNSEFWLPLTFNRFQLERSARLFVVTGRLKEGTTMAEAQADIAAIAAQLARDFPQRQQGWMTRLVPLREYWFGWVRQPLMTLEVAVILVLLIVCASVSTLMLARVPAWQPEISVRLRMGAGRGRIVRQFLTESLLLSIVGGAFGVFIARWGVSALERLPSPLGGVAITGMAQRGGILGFAAVLAVISSLLFGFVPALVASSSGSNLREAIVHRRRGSLSGILVSAQIGLALILLVSSGLLFNSFVRLVLDDRGFNPKGIVTFQYRIPIEDYMDRLVSYRGLPAAEITPPTLAMQRVYEKLKTLPGAESVAGSSAPPVDGILLPTATLHIDGRPAPTGPTDQAASVIYFLVTDNFFETMKAPISRGRDFDARDSRSSPWVAVINETMAQRFWPGENPIGKQFTVDAALGERPREVIGVVRDVSLRSVRTGPPQAVAYANYLQQPEKYEGLNAGMFGQMTFIVRSAQDPAIMVSSARRAAAEVDPNRPLANVQTMSSSVVGRMRTRSFYVAALGGSAFLATVLSALGVYGVMSSSVSQRARERRIRVSMGARARDIIGLIGIRALWPVAVGLFWGFLGSLVLTRWLDWQLWGVTSTDPATFAAVTALLTGVYVAACFISARRTVRASHGSFAGGVKLRRFAPESLRPYGGG